MGRQHLFRTVLNFTGYMEIPSRVVKYNCGDLQTVAPAPKPEGIDASRKRETLHA